MLRLGLGLVAIGAAALLIYGGYFFVTLFLLDAEVSLIARVSVTVIVFGVLLMLLSLIRERYRDMMQESFRGVKK